MSDYKVPMQQLTSYPLNDHIWQLWRKDVIIGLKCIQACNIMVGTEARPRPSTPATTQSIPSPDPELEAARLRLTEATVTQHVAEQLALEDAENDATQNEFKQRKQTFQLALAEFTKPVENKNRQDI